MTRAMNHALTRKLEGYEPLSGHERWALNGLVPRMREFAARADLIREGDAPENVHLILDGFACRYKVLPDGRRRIMAYLVPGDFCDLNVFILDEMDHNIGTISPCKVVHIPRPAIEGITAHHPGIARAFWWCALVDEAVLREWLVNIGGRPPNQRVAHFVCEMLTRLDAVGQAGDDGFAFPFTMADLADSMGLSEADVDRTVRELQSADLIALDRGVLIVPDVERLKTYCEFTPNYLHLRNARWQGRRMVPWATAHVGCNS